MVVLQNKYQDRNKYQDSCKSNQNKTKTNIKKNMQKKANEKMRVYIDTCAYTVLQKIADI